MGKLRRFEVYSETSSYIPEKVDEFMKFWQDKIALVPTAHRASAHIEVDAVGDYDGGHCLEVVVSYWREETRKELADREKAKGMREKTLQRKERAEFHRLKEKYEGGA